MRVTCGCDSHDPDATRIVELEQALLLKNSRLAADNRRRFARSRVTVLNLIGSPGAGKTALLEAVIGKLDRRIKFAVLEGDQATELDAERIRQAGCPAHQVNTGAGCHLDAAMTARGFEALSPPPNSILFIENVGNLLCPALFDLGEDAKIAVMSVTEGEDKPTRYPHVFRAAQVLALTKLDLVPHLDFDLEACLAYARAVNPWLQVFCLSARSGEGLDAFCDWLLGSPYASLIKPAVLA